MCNLKSGLMNKHFYYFSTAYFKKDLKNELTFSKVLHKQWITFCKHYSHAKVFWDDWHLAHTVARRHVNVNVVILLVSSDTVLSYRHALVYVKAAECV